MNVRNKSDKWPNEHEKIMLKVEKGIVFNRDYILLGVLSWTVKSLTLNEGKIINGHTLFEGVFF